MASPDLLVDDLVRLVRALDRASRRRRGVGGVPEVLRARAVRLAFDPAAREGDPDAGADDVREALDALPGEVSADRIAGLGEALGAALDADGRRDGGIYYTPLAISRAVVDRVLEPRLEAARKRLAREPQGTMDEVRTIRVLDPACGGGRFLLAAGRRLLAFHREARERLGEEAEALPSPGVLAGRSLAGVDLDPAAVAACRLALRRAGLEGARVVRGDALISGDDLRAGVNPAPPPGVRPGLVVDQVRAGFTPAPGDAVREGIARRVREMASGRQPVDPRDLVRTRRALDRRVAAEVEAICVDEAVPVRELRPLHWSLAFPEAVARGGFDVVCGNPPWLSVRRLGRNGPRGRAVYRFLAEGERWSGRFRSHADLHQFFVLRGLELCCPGGGLGLVLPAYWLWNEWSDRLREGLLERGRVEAIWDLGPRRPFDASVEALCLFVRKEPDDEGAPSSRPAPDVRAGFTPAPGPDGRSTPANEADETVAYRRLDDGKGGTVTEKDLEALAGPEPGPGVQETRRELAELGAAPWTVLGRSAGGPLDRMAPDGERVLPLGELARIGQGPTCGANRVFRVAADEAERLELEAEALRPSIKNGAVEPWAVRWDGTVCIFSPGIDDIAAYPAVEAYLETHREALEGRSCWEPDRMAWWAWLRPFNLDLFATTPKIVCPYRARRTTFAVDRRGFWNEGGDVRAVLPRNGTIGVDALCAVLDSTPVHAWYRAHGKRKGPMLELFTRPLERVPVPVLEPDEEAELAGLARAREAAGGEEAAADVDRAIDRAVARAYGMGPRELEEVRRGLEAGRG